MVYQKSNTTAANVPKNSALSRKRHKETIAYVCVHACA